MKTKLLRIALLAAALVAYGCTNKEIEGPDESGAPDNNVAPVADAGADLIAIFGDNTIVNGAGSDVDGTIVSYNWSQASGPSISNAFDTQIGALSIIHPFEVAEPITVVFELRVTDDDGATSEPDSVTITILPVYDKFLGTAVEQPEDLTGPLTDYFSQVTPGNAGKWGSVEGTRDIMDWTNLDNIHTYAENQELLFKQHTLFWGQQQPGWLSGLTPEEQEAEIIEWLEALAAHYTPDDADAPDLDMIDVVNEPLHAPPAYIEALGGEGETGWDWLITAFELARDHFPNSTLILNDYHILNLEENTEDYLLLVNLLRDLGLIDGIGVQAHFLEQVSADTVKHNLDLLGATGLPIYVSEFEINYADDARHANKLAELFTVFWEHPAVAGVTHWGYREGGVWRENAWLLNSDGTERPALAWLRCYAIEGNEDCVLPEYVPAGWAGDASGLVLEAELYDEGEGVQASGNIVSHADAGDWMVFRSVQFQTDWDSVKVKYAKGGDTTGSISVRLDCGDDINSCAEVASIPLPPTGGWSNFRTVNIPWTPGDGAHDVFLHFMHVAGVGNIDLLRFGPSDVVQVNLVDDGGFETGSADWAIWWDSSLGEVEQSNAEAQEGEYSLRVFNRLDGSGNRPTLDITSKVVAGETYPVSLWVKHSGPEAAPFNLSYKRLCNVDDESYPIIAQMEAVPAGEWVQLSGELDLSACDTVNEIKIYLQNTPISVENIYIDNVEVLGWGTPAPEPEAGDNLVSDGGFEGSSLDGDWSAWYATGTTVELSSEQFQEGTQSLKVSTRTENSNPSYDLTDKVENGQQYAVSAWVFHTGPAEAPVTFSAKLACAAGEEYPRIFDGDTEDPIPANQWVKLEGVLDIPADCDVGEARIYFEGTPLEVETLYIDDVQVLPPTGEAEPEPEPEPESANLLTNGDFETGIDGWGAGWAGGITEQSSEQASAGSFSLKASGFGDSGAYASYILTGLVTAGTSYSVSAQVRHSGAEATTVRLNGIVKCTDETTPADHNAYPWLESNIAVASGTWTELAGTLEIPACEVTEVQIYLEGTPVGTDVYIDEVSVTEQ